MSHIPTALTIKWTPPGALAVAEACITHWPRNINFKSPGREV